VVDTARLSGASRIIAVVGHRRDLVMEHLNDRVEFAIQDQQLGTGHAVLMAENLMENFSGEALILSGDVPLLRLETIHNLIQMHHHQGNDCTMISCLFPDPAGYGRILRSGSGEVVEIVEHKDASPQQLLIKEINSGIYLVNALKLFKSLHTLKNDNVQGEYYLTDIISDFETKGLKVGAFIVDDPWEIAGVNSVEQLWALEAEFRRRNPESKSSV
jgi:bifunctional UDP-N-acetylglucosamine pyrophosphorylase/glucosamine-1-phosphate N-acetyltransferase